MELKTNIKIYWNFGLICLFKGISTIVGYLMPKASLLESSSGTNL